jgi:hypothetical protein
MDLDSIQSAHACPIYAWSLPCLVTDSCFGLLGGRTKGCGSNYLFLKRLNTGIPQLISHTLLWGQAHQYVSKGCRWIQLLRTSGSGSDQHCLAHPSHQNPFSARPPTCKWPDLIADGVPVCACLWFFADNFDSVHSLKAFRFRDWAELICCWRWKKILLLVVQPPFFNKADPTWINKGLHW